MDKVPAINLLTGSAAFRETVEAGGRLNPLFAAQARAEAEFRAAREAFLHYS